MFKKITLTLLITILTTVAHADCKNEYRTYVARDAITSAGLIGAGIYVMYASAIPFSIAESIMLNDPISAAGLRGLGTTTIGTGGAGAGGGMSFSAHGVSLIRSMRLINQSEVGFGKALTNITEELSLELDREILEEEVAEIITSANEEGHFCSGKLKKPFTRKQIYIYVKGSLSN